jgi:methionyl-tRNA synthetase
MIMSAAKSDALLRDEKQQPKLPTHVFAHGFFTLNGQKISKSLGNAIDPRDFIPSYGFDTVRYFVLREISFGEDGDFSFDRLKERYQSDLANTLGNLVNRVVSMSRKYFDGKIPEVKEFSTARTEVWGGEIGMNVLEKKVTEALDRYRCDMALEAIWSGVGDGLKSGIMQANKYIEETQPFKLIKESPERVGQIMYELLEAIRCYAWLISPMMPTISNKMFTQLGLNAEEEIKKGWSNGLKWGQLKPGSTLPEPSVLFPRIETGA